MKKKMFAGLMAVLLAVLAFNLAFAAEGSWGDKSEASVNAPAPVIRSCSWSGNKLSIAWTAVPGVKSYLVMAKSMNIRNCAMIRSNTSKLSVNRVATGSCQDIVIIQPIGKGVSTSISKAACSLR
jgi:hypothetical protein